LWGLVVLLDGVGSAAEPRLVSVPPLGDMAGMAALGVRIGTCVDRDRRVGKVAAQCGLKEFFRWLLLGSSAHLR
jgi:hypothetical protein